MLANLNNVHMCFLHILLLSPSFNLAWLFPNTFLHICPHTPLLFTMLYHLHNSHVKQTRLNNKQAEI